MGWLHPCPMQGHVLLAWGMHAYRDIAAARTQLLCPKMTFVWVCVPELILGAFGAVHPHGWYIWSSVCVLLGAWMIYLEQQLCSARGMDDALQQRLCPAGGMDDTFTAAAAVSCSGHRCKHFMWRRPEVERYPSNVRESPLDSCHGNKCSQWNISPPFLSGDNLKFRFYHSKLHWLSEQLQRTNFSKGDRQQ